MSAWKTGLDSNTLQEFSQAATTISVGKSHILSVIESCDENCDGKFCCINRRREPITTVFFSWHICATNLQRFNNEILVGFNTFMYLNSNRMSVANLATVNCDGNLRREFCKF